MEQRISTKIDFNVLFQTRIIYIYIYIQQMKARVQNIYNCVTHEYLFTKQSVNIVM